MRCGVPILCLLAACGAGDSFDADSAGSVDATTSHTEDVDTAGGPTSPPDEGAADWYALDAQLEVVAGEIVLGGATALRATLHDALLSEVCTHDVPIESVRAVPPLDGEPADLGWWELTLLDGTPDATPCAEFSARELRLGVGPYDPRLDPALAAQQAPGEPDPYGDALYGLYVQEYDDGPLWVLGVVTMPGLRPADLVSEPPLPDGTYEAHSLLLLAFPNP